MHGFADGDERRDKNGPQLPRNTRKRSEKGESGLICLLFSKAGLGILYSESESAAIQCTLRREREMGERRLKSKGRVLPATRHRMRKESGI